MKLALAFQMLCTFLGCSSKAQPKPVLDSSALATAEERVSAFMKFSTTPLPSAILDAQFLAENIGGGTLGPSDTSMIARLEIAEAQVSVWQKWLQEAGPTSETWFSRPTDPTWWPRALDPKTALYSVNRWFPAKSGLAALSASSPRYIFLSVQSQ